MTVKVEIFAAEEFEEFSGTEFYERNVSSGYFKGSETDFDTGFIQLQFFDKKQNEIRKIRGQFLYRKGILQIQKNRPWPLENSILR